MFDKRISLYLCCVGSVYNDNNVVKYNNALCDWNNMNFKRVFSKIGLKCVCVGGEIGWKKCTNLAVGVHFGKFCSFLERKKNICVGSMKGENIRKLICFIFTTKINTTSYT